MSDGLVSTLVAWLPLLLVFVVWLLFMRRMHNPKGGISQYAYMEQLLKAEQEQHKALLALIERMDQRLARLEDRDRKE